MGAGEPRRLVLSTALAGVEVRRLDPRDAVEYHDLVVRNLEHLSTLPGVETMTPERWAREFSNTDERVLHLGLFLDGELIGSLTLTPLSMAIGAHLPDDPNGFALGYWIGEQYGGRGYVTEACHAVLDYARSDLGASAFWSSTARTNAPSIRVLQKLGFSIVDEESDGLRFHREA